MIEYDVIVAGVGGMGSATVAELAARGARVLGLERAGIPNDGGSSHGVNRIIRLAYAEDPRYVPLLRRAYARWRALEAQLGETILVTTGGLDIGRADSETVAGALASAREHDLAHELLEAAEVRSRFPGLALPDELVAVYQPDGGFVLSERAIAGHARLALEAGAEIHGHEPVLAWEAARRRRGRAHRRRPSTAPASWWSAPAPGWASSSVRSRR